MFEEIVSAPGKMYLAAVGSSFPDIDATPTTPWGLLGENGDLNITDAGIKVMVNRGENAFAPFGSTMDVKQWLNKFDVMVRAEFADLTLETLSKAMGFNEVDLAAGIKTLNFYQGVQKTPKALLLRFPNASPYRQDAALAFAFPTVVQQGNFELDFNRGSSPAVVALEFKVLRNGAASSEGVSAGWTYTKEADT